MFFSALGHPPAEAARRYSHTNRNAVSLYTPATTQHLCTTCKGNRRAVAVALQTQWPLSSLNLVRVDCVSHERYDRRAAHFMGPCSWPIFEALLSSPTYPWRVIEGPTTRLCPFRIKLIGVWWKYAVRIGLLVGWLANPEHKFIT